MEVSESDSIHLHKDLHKIDDAGTLVQMITSVRPDTFNSELSKCLEHVRRRAVKRGIDPEYLKPQIPSSKSAFKQLISRLRSDQDALEHLKLEVAAHKVKFRIPDSETLLHVWMFMAVTECIIDGLGKNEFLAGSSQVTALNTLPSKPAKLNSNDSDDHRKFHAEKSEIVQMSGHEASDIEYEDERDIDTNTIERKTSSSQFSPRSPSPAIVMKTNRSKSSLSSSPPFTDRTPTSQGRPGFYTPGPPPPPNLPSSSSQSSFVGLPDQQQLHGLTKSMSFREPSSNSRIFSPTESSFSTRSDSPRYPLIRRKTEPKSSSKKGTSAVSFLAKWIF